MEREIFYLLGIPTIPGMNQAKARSQDLQPRHCAVMPDSECVLMHPFLLGSHSLSLLLYFVVLAPCRALVHADLSKHW